MYGSPPPTTEPEAPPGSGCSCTNLVVVLAQFSGLTLGAILGARRGLLYGALGAVAGLVGGTVLAILAIGLTGLVVFAGLWVTERCCPSGAREMKGTSSEDEFPP